MPPLARQRGAALRGHHVGVDLLVDSVQIEQDAAVDRQHAHQQSQHQGPEFLGDGDLIQIHGKTDLFSNNAGAWPWRPADLRSGQSFLSTLDGAWLIIVMPLSLLRAVNPHSGKSPAAAPGSEKDRHLQWAGAQVLSECRSAQPLRGLGWNADA